MRFLHPEDEHKEVTYDDVFLVPQYSDASSRMDADLTPVDGIGTTIPIVVANMTAVAGRRMAETVARRGGLVILPQDMPIDRVREVVSYVKSRHPVFETPVVLHETESVQTALNLMYKRAHGAVMVVNDENKPIGIFTEKDAFQRDRFTLLRDVMSREMITMPDTATPQEIFDAIRIRRVPVMPIIKASGELAGVLTAKGALRATIYKPAQNAQGQLLTAMAVGVNQDVTNKVEELLRIGVDVIVLDTAHGHQGKMIDAIRTARALLGRARPLVA
ncbi:MAG: IMP dehydrogenase, partial [Patescibacteria group bacterium]